MPVTPATVAALFLDKTPTTPASPVRAVKVTTVANRFDGPIYGLHVPDPDGTLASYCMTVTVGDSPNDADRTFKLAYGQTIRWPLPVSRVWVKSNNGVAPDALLFLSPDCFVAAPRNALNIPQLVEPSTTGSVQNTPMFNIGFYDNNTPATPEVSYANPLPVTVSSAPVISVGGVAVVAPAANAVLSDTAANLSSSPTSELQVSFSTDDTAGQLVQVAHRNAANSADLAILAEFFAFNTAGMQSRTILRRAFAAGERVVVRMGPTAGTAAKRYWSSIQIKYLG